MIVRNIDGMKAFQTSGTMINNLRYADDTMIIAESEEQLQGLMNVIVVYSEEKELMLNSVKSLTMIFSKSPTVTKCKTVVNGKLE